MGCVSALTQEMRFQKQLLPLPLTLTNALTFPLPHIVLIRQVGIKGVPRTEALGSAASGIRHEAGGEKAGDVFTALTGHWLFYF